MGTQQTDKLNWDSEGRYTTGELGNPGDGTEKWYLWVKAANGGLVPIGATTDAAVAPGANGNVIQLLKGLLAAFKAEDATAASGDLVLPAGAVRRDTPTADGANGDYVPLHVDALGRLRVVGTHAEDAAHANGDYGNFILGVASLTRTARSADGDYTPMAVGLAGENFVANVPEANSAWACSTHQAHAAASGVIKASAGKLFQATITNDNATMEYAMFFNLAAVPADGTAPSFALCVPSKTTVQINMIPFGRYFSTGICWCNSSTFATKTIGPADFSVSALYL